ncbi:hypothetical protein [Dactylosporangium sp. NPDC049140]|uniref:hypothetical protein n=1 Tax=Dactylosporangium sp. NPDC049140 TaxID=3155647 RepID=UPI0033EC39CB
MIATILAHGSAARGALPIGWLVARTAILRVENHGRGGDLIVKQQGDELVEKHDEIGAAGQVVVLVDDPVAG